MILILKIKKRYPLNSIKNCTPPKKFYLKSPHNYGYYYYSKNKL